MFSSQCILSTQDRFNDILFTTMVSFISRMLKTSLQQKGSSSHPFFLTGSLTDRELIYFVSIHLDQIVHSHSFFHIEIPSSFFPSSTSFQSSCFLLFNLLLLLLLLTHQPPSWESFLTCFHHNFFSSHHVLLAQDDSQSDMIRCRSSLTLPCLQVPYHTQCRIFWYEYRGYCEIFTPPPLALDM